MGVEYRHYLVPCPRRTLPTPEQIVGLVKDLEFHGWIAASSSAIARYNGREFAVPVALSAEWIVRHSGNDLILQWSVDSLAGNGVRHPLEPNENPPEETYYDLQIHLPQFFVNVTSELIDPFEITECACGARLEPTHRAFKTFCDPGFPLYCPACGRSVDVDAWEVTVRNGWTGDAVRVAGGCTYRFAVVIDCGKCIPCRRRETRVQPEFVAACTRALGCRMDSIGDMY